MQQLTRALVKTTLETVPPMFNLTFYHFVNLWDNPLYARKLFLYYKDLFAGLMNYTSMWYT